jgi:plastocyanin
LSKPLVALALILAAAVPAVADAGARSATRVAVGDDYFVRPNGVPAVRVSKGTRVRWVWTGSSVHNVTAVKGPARFRSASKTAGSYSRELRKRGTYMIICTIHGAANQKMKLIVE